MGKIEDTLNTLGFIAIEISYFIWGAFLSIFLPVMNYSAPPDSLIGKIRFPFSIYTTIVGSLYIISGFYILRRKSIGLKFTVVVNILGIILCVPIMLGLISFYFFTRPQIRKQFKR